MSNNSLIARIESTLVSVEAGDISARVLADTIRSNGRALERMPYPLINELESLAMALEVGSWHEQDGFVPDLHSIIANVRAWLRQLPREVS